MATFRLVHVTRDGSGDTNGLAEYTNSDTVLLPIHSSDPSGTTEGEMIYNSSEDKIKIYDGSAWQVVGNTTEQIQDIVGAMFTGNTETNISVTYEDSDGTIDLVSTDTTLTTEEVQDIVGAMFSSNTETGITATYEDSDGTIDLVVSADSDLIKDADNDTKIQVEESSDEDKIRYDVAGTEVAVQDAGGIALTSSGGTFRHNQTQASTYSIASGEGVVMAGPVTITGTITNNGTLVIM